MVLLDCENQALLIITIIFTERFLMNNTSSFEFSKDTVNVVENKSFNPALYPLIDSIPVCKVPAYFTDTDYYTELGYSVYSAYRKYKNWTPVEFARYFNAVRDTDNINWFYIGTQFSYYSLEHCCDNGEETRYWVVERRARYHKPILAVNAIINQIGQDSWEDFTNSGKASCIAYLFKNGLDKASEVEHILSDCGEIDGYFFGSEGDSAWDLGRIVARDDGLEDAIAKISCGYMFGNYVSIDYMAIGVAYEEDHDNELFRIDYRDLKGWYLLQ